MAELFAAHAAIARAIGTVMERYDLDEDQAFAYLLRVSSHSNVRLRDIAEELVLRRRERWDPVGVGVNAEEPGTSTPT